MSRIRNMAKKIKRNRQMKRDSLGLTELTREMDQIIGQIDKIPKSTSRNKKQGNSRKSSNSRESNVIPSLTRNKEGRLVSTSINKKKKLIPKTTQMLLSLSKEQKRNGLKYSRLEQERKARKLKNFKNIMQSQKNKRKTRKMYKERKGRNEKSVFEKDPLKLTSELEDIFKTISSLENQELGNTYHKQRKKKLKTLMRSSKLANIRKTMNFRRDESDILLNSQSDLKSEELLDKNYTMKKCPKCTLYFPLEKIARHCRDCRK